MIESYQIDNIRKKDHPISIALGNFDGIHLGHAKVIETAVDAAKKNQGEAWIITFDPHPRRYFRQKEPGFLLSDIIEKNRILSLHGIEIIVYVNFNDGLRQLSPEQFVSNVLHPLGVSHLVAGTDFAFGRGRAGDMALLSSLGKNYKIKITSVPLKVDNKSAIVSSSRVRAALQAGRIDDAREMLGRPPTICGTIEHGDKRGRQLNFPTANFSLEDCQVPAYGVYAITAAIEKKDIPFDDSAKSLSYFDLPILKGVANIGIRPTIGDRKVMAEVHLFEFDDDIYGTRLCVNLHYYMRGEKKFDSLTSLKLQISKDVDSAKEILAKNI